MSGILRPSTLALLLGGAVLLPSCRKEPAEPQWDIDVLAPLVKTTLSIGDIVPDSLLSTDAAGNVSVLFTERLFSLSLDTVLTAPDTSFSYAYALPFPGPLTFQPGQTFNASDDVTRFDLDNLQLTQLIVRSGQVDIAITNMMNGNIIGDFSLPGASLGGVPFTVEQHLPPGTPSNPGLGNAARSLNGYSFDLRGPDHNDVNSLATHLSYACDPNGGPVAITDQDSLLALVSYHDIVPEYATGSFGTRNIQVDSTSTDLDLFANMSGVIDLDQVTATLKVRNGIGVDVQADIHYLKSVNGSSGNTVELDNTITSAPLNIDRALDLGGSFQSALNTFTLDGSNSNIEAFIENLPAQVDYAMDVTINPLGDISNGHDFLYHDSRLDADLELNIPLRIIATDLTLQKIVDVDLAGSAQAHALRHGTLHLFATNGFPFSANINLAIVDAQGQILSNLLEGGTIASGVLGPGGLVNTSTDSRIDFDVDDAQMDLLHAGAQLRITAVFNTADQDQHVQLRSDQKLELQVTANANYVVNGNE